MLFFNRLRLVRSDQQPKVAPLDGTQTGQKQQFHLVYPDISFHITCYEFQVASSELTNNYKLYQKTKNNR